MAQLKETLDNFEAVLSNNDAFDSEDLGFIQDCKANLAQYTIDLERDQELMALQTRLPERQRWLQKMDETLRLSQLFPNMMALFAAKDAELQAIIDMKLKERAQQRY